jgi:hypothetical protein
LSEPHFAIADHHALVAHKKPISALNEDRSPNFRGEDPAEVAFDRTRITIDTRSASPVHPQGKGDKPRDRGSILSSDRALETG